MEDFKSEGESYTLILSKWKRVIIDIGEVMTILKYRDVRSVLNWCKQHNVFVLNQGNTQVVNQVEFILAFYKPFMHHLKRTKENWKDLFVDYVCGNVKGVVGDKDDIKKSMTSYKPQSEMETSFLQKMKNL
jgi:hypothetical protein